MKDLKIKVTMRNGSEIVTKIAGESFENVIKQLAKDIVRNKVIVTRDAVFRGQDVVLIKEFK